MALPNPGQNNTRYEVITQEDPDTGDVMLPIPQALLDSMGWKEGDTIDFGLDENGHYIFKENLMTYTINQSMIGSDPIDTSYTVTTTNNTSGSGLYWGLNGTSAMPGQVLTSNGTSTQWATIASDPNLKGASIQVKGDAEFEGNVKIKGKDLSEMLEKIEERLAILHPNEKLEDKWDELKELGKRYKELEQEIIEKEKMWAILKK